MIDASVSSLELTNASMMLRRLALHKDHPILPLLTAACYVLEVAIDAQDDLLTTWSCECGYRNVAWRDIEDLSCVECQLVPL